MTRRRSLSGWVAIGVIITASTSGGRTRADAGAQDDGAIGPLLTAVATCDGKRITDECAPRNAWKAHLEKVDAEDADTEAGKADRRRHAVTCLAQIAHASPGVREAAAACLADVAAHAPDRREAARALIARYAVDRSHDVRVEQLRALQKLDPTEQGLTADVLALARPLVGSGLGRAELRELVRALEPDDLPPTPEAVAFATELVRHPEVATDAVRVLGSAPTLPPETCASLLALAETKRGAWADAVEVIGKKEARCKESRARAVQIVVEVARRPAGPSKKLGLGEASAPLASMVRGDGIGAEDKTRLREAVKIAEVLEGRAALDPLRDHLERK